MKKQRNKIVGGWLAAVVSLLFVSACRAPTTPQAGRYQWTIVPREDRIDSICVIDTHTGDVAEWEKVAQVWRLKESVALPDFEALRGERAKRKEQAKEAREKRDALVKSYAQMPLEQQVAWAKKISVKKRTISPRWGGDRLASSGIPTIYRFMNVEFLKHERGLNANELRHPYTATDEDLVVWFEGMADDDLIVFGLSRTPIESERIFPAPATIIDDVKAEIKRQEKKQEEAHAENH